MLHIKETKQWMKQANLSSVSDWGNFHLGVRVQIFSKDRITTVVRQPHIQGPLYTSPVSAKKFDHTNLSRAGFELRSLGLLAFMLPINPTLLVLYTFLLISFSFHFFNDTELKITIKHLPLFKQSHFSFFLFFSLTNTHTHFLSF